MAHTNYHASNFALSLTRGRFAKANLPLDLLLMQHLSTYKIVKCRRHINTYLNNCKITAYLEIIQRKIKILILTEEMMRL